MVKSAHNIRKLATTPDAVRAPNPLTMKENKSGPVRNMVRRSTTLMKGKIIKNIKDLGVGQVSFKMQSQFSIS